MGLSKDPMATLFAEKKKYGFKDLNNTTVIVKVVDNQREVSQNFLILFLETFR